MVIAQCEESEPQKPPLTAEKVDSLPDNGSYGDVLKDFEGVLGGIVQSVTEVGRQYRALEHTYMVFGRQKKILKLYDRAREVEQKVDRTEDQFSRLMLHYDKVHGSSMGQEYIDSHISPLLLYTRNAVHDLALRSESMNSDKDQPPDEFCCCVCLDLLYHPVSLMCSHRFCEHCLKLSTKKDKRCPLCRRPNMARHFQEDTELNSFLKHRYPSLYRERQLDRFQRQQREYERLLLLYQNSVRQARANAEQNLTTRA